MNLPPAAPPAGPWRVEPVDGRSSSGKATLSRRFAGTPDLRHDPATELVVAVPIGGSPRR